MIVNDALRAPDEIVTLAGTCATPVLLLAKEITAPDGGAAPFNVTVPVDDDPPVTVLGLNTRELLVILAGLTVRVVVLVTLR